MHAADSILDVAGSTPEDYMRMHGYWVQMQESQDNTQLSGNDSRNSSITGPTGHGDLVTGPFGFPEGSAARSPCPLVEDDDEEEDGDEDANATMLAFFLRQRDGSICNSAQEQQLQQTTPAHPETTVSLQNTASTVAAVRRRKSSAEASLRGNSQDDPVPSVEEEALGDLGDVIGYGGDRGSFVCRVPFPPLLHALQQRPSSFSSPFSLSSPQPSQEREAYKKYPTQISPDELSFVATAYRCAADSAHCQSRHSPFLTTEEAQYAALHLVLPDAIVTQGGRKVGLLMPLYNCSLKEYLQGLSTAGLHPNGGSSAGPAGITSGVASSVASRRNSSSLRRENTAGSSDDGPQGAFRFAVTYRPVESIPVICAVAFQVLEAVAYLNHRLPHNSGSTGYTHNDLHLDNVLLSYEGDVALCDFELVASTPNPVHNADIRRLPPSSRQSPHGLFSETADTWAFGLIMVSLLTGVDPLFTSSIVNDFSDGPLLSRWDSGACVLDWEGNIKAHVETLLRLQDKSGRRLEEAQGLLRVCGKCLVNREGAEPLRAVDLLEDALFLPYRNNFRLATQTVRNWTAGAR